MQTKTRKVIIAAALAGVSYLLMYASFPIIPGFSWMKIDFSDVPVLLGLLILGFGDGIWIAVIRSLLYFVLAGPSIDRLIGVGSAFLATLAFTIPLYLFLHKRGASMKSFLLGGLAAVVSLTIIMSLANWLFITPAYMAVLGLKLPFSLGRYVMTVVAPFNIIKGVIISLVFELIYVNLRNWISSKQAELNH